MNKKALIRQEVIQSFKQMDEPTYLRASTKLHSHLIHSSVWQKSKVIALTVATDKEVATIPLILKALEEGKKVVLPAVDKEHFILTFYYIHSLRDIKTGFAGIKEPAGERLSLANPEEIDLVIVPGFAFSKEGYRVGYGGGYYDRFLASWHGNTCSLVLPFQERKALPSEPHDVPVDYLVFEDGVKPC